MAVIPTIRREIPAVLALALPIVAGLGASTLLGVTDAVMLAPLGPLPLAVVGITIAVAVILRNGLTLGVVVGIAGAVVMLSVWQLLPFLGQPPEVLAIMFPLLGGDFATDGAFCHPDRVQIHL